MMRSWGLKGSVWMEDKLGEFCLRSEMARLDPGMDAIPAPATNPAQSPRFAILSSCSLRVPGGHPVAAPRRPTTIGLLPAQSMSPFVSRSASSPVPRIHAQHGRDSSRLKVPCSTR